MGQVLCLPAQKQLHVCSHMWINPQWVPVPGSQSVILEAQNSQGEGEKL